MTHADDHGPPDEGPPDDEVQLDESEDEAQSSEDESGEIEDVIVPDDASSLTDEPVDPEIQLAERTADLQRLQAEFLNYKRRVDRDRELIRENATYAALAPITEVLDTIARAREHGPLDDGLKAVAEQLERVVAGLGLIKFGEPGDAFDPTIHEALSTSARTRRSR